MSALCALTRYDLYKGCTQLTHALSQKFLSLILNSKAWTEIPRLLYNTVTQENTMNHDELCAMELAMLSRIKSIR